MQDLKKELEYTTDIFKREMAVPGWYNGLEGVKPSAANMLKKRFFEGDGDMTPRMIVKLMNHFGYIMKEKKRDALWEKAEPRKWHLKNASTDFGIIEAPTEDMAKDILTKEKHPRKKMFTDPFGEEHNLQDLFRCKLIAEEIK